MNGYFVTGTDTNVGKTIASSWLMLHFSGCYWKPVQTGGADLRDKAFVQHVTGFPETHFFDSRIELEEPLSPHEAAAREGISISADQFSLPETQRPLIVEGAGGVLVPLNERETMLDLIAAFKLPVIIVARSGLGTINHTLLTLLALRQKEATIAGVIMSGKIAPHNKAAIEEFGDVDVICEIPQFDTLSRDILRSIPPNIPSSEWASNK